MTITQAQIGDIATLAQISKDTFFETFADTNTAEDMAHYLMHSFSEEKLTIELLNPFSAFYCASVDGRVVGYLKINWDDAQTEVKDKDSLEVERLYVLKAYHGQQIGQQLFDVALSIARHQQFKYVWLGVWEKNERAIAFYAKNGFEAFGQHIFQLGQDKQIDVLMRCKVDNQMRNGVTQ